MTRRLWLLLIPVLVLVAVYIGTTGPGDESDGAGSDGEEISEETAAQPAITDGRPEPDPTPIPVSDDVRVGTLDNGLTYYVRSNQSPGGSLSLRLVVNAGSLQQEAPESGYAHFLEHMLFNGTENFPGNELTDALAGLGIQFGPDVNAYTSFDETVYELDLVTVDDAAIETGFDVLADWAARATIAQDATEAERGVVREEIRLRDEGPDGFATAAFLAAYLTGSPYEDREPGGSAEEIVVTDAEDLRAFYDRWYRPELMAVVAVGDLPLDRMEDEIRDRFSELFDDPVGRGDGAERIEVVAEPIAEPHTDVVAHPELARSFGSIDYSLTTWGQATVGGERLTLIQDLFARMIGNRLADAAGRGEIDLGEPFVLRFDQTRAHSFLGFNYEADDLLVGTEYILTEMDALERDGFTADDLARAVAEFQVAVDQLLATEATTQDREYADAYVAHYLDGDQISGVAETHARLSTVLSSIALDEVNDLFRWEMAQAAPIVIMVGPDEALLPTVEQLDDAIVRAEAGAGPSPEQTATETVEELMTRPEPVAPVETGTVSEPVATEWVFANGVTVRFVDSAIAAGQVDVVAIAEGGWSALDLEAGELAPYAVAAVADSGLGDFDRVDVRRFLAGTTVRLSPFVDETTEGFVGGAGSDDLEVLFQQLHLAVTAPRIDPLALEEVVGDADDGRRSVAADPGAAAFEALNEIRFGDDVRFSLLPPDDLEALSPDQALAIYTERLGSVDDLVVIVVGDIDEATVADLAAAYLGTLPGGDPDTWTDVRPEPLDEVVRRDVVAGTGDAAGTVIVLYPSAPAIDAPVRIRLRLLELILNERLLATVREELGVSYSPASFVDARVDPADLVEVYLFANVDPTRVDEVVDVFTTLADDLATNGVTVEELDRARSILQDDFDLVGNNDYIEMLLTAEGEDVLTAERRAELLAAVTATDLDALAAQVLPSDAAAVVVTTPG